MPLTRETAQPDKSPKARSVLRGGEREGFCGALQGSGGSRAVSVLTKSATTASGTVPKL